MRENISKHISVKFPIWLKFSKYDRCRDSLVDGAPLLDNRTFITGAKLTPVVLNLSYKTYIKIYFKFSMICQH